MRKSRLILEAIAAMVEEHKHIIDGGRLKLRSLRILVRLTGDGLAVDSINLGPEWESEKETRP